jgi:hypothetical protein
MSSANFVVIAPRQPRYAIDQKHIALYLLIFIYKTI